MGPEFDELARELRARVGPELRADAEEAERLAAQAALRARSLADVGRDLMARGDVVQVVVGPRRFQGRIIHVAGDLLSVATPAGTVHVNLAQPLELRVVSTAGEGRATEPGITSFRAQLRALELDGSPVEVGSSVSGDQYPCRIVAVAGDHLVLSGGDAQWYLAASAVTHVLVPAP